MKRGVGAHPCVVMILGVPIHACWRPCMSPSMYGRDSGDAHPRMLKTLDVPVSV